MQNCPTKKRSFHSAELAEEALIGAHIHFNYGKGQGPIGFYQCEECGSYHFTSKGSMNIRLAQMLNDGMMQKQKEVKWWEDKFRKK